MTHTKEQTNQNIDIVCGLAWGDEGKGKVVSYLNSQNQYEAVCRWAGGDNAGHTVYVNGAPYKTHLIPSGIFSGTLSIVGPGCVVNKTGLYKELVYLQENSFDISQIKISPKAHIVTTEHLEVDKRELSESLGTTSRGIAPCYASKAARTGSLAKDVLPQSLLWDEKLPQGPILCEGAQGFWLDIDQGNYPFVTSSITLPYGACGLGFSPKRIRNIYGVAKIYDTRSGVDPLFPQSLLENPTLSRLGILGKERGVTTGRRRQTNWLNLTKLIEAINKSGTTHLILNKCDILEELNTFLLLINFEPVKFDSLKSMISFVKRTLKKECSLLEEIVFSYSPSKI